jgi:D-glycero-alpha-D-manno-heptose-7-phosphate kinase
LQDLDYDEYKIADIAYRAERDELKIKGGWQDQYAAVMGGFNFMEFNKEKNLIYPLKIKPEIVHEFNSHLTLCYVGESHFSSELHAKQEANFSLNEDEMARSLNELKELAAKIKDSLLLNDLENIGKLMHESWVNKRKLNNNVTNSKIDRLYEIALQNGVYGGRLLGAGGGGYLLFFHSPKIRNNLKKVLEKEGGEVVNFSFEFNGTSIFPVKSKG